MSIIFYQTKNDIDSELKHTKKIVLNMIVITALMSGISFFIYKQLNMTNIKTENNVVIQQDKN